MKHNAGYRNPFLIPNRSNYQQKVPDRQGFLNLTSRGKFMHREITRCRAVLCPVYMNRLEQ
ncbi:MAG: hypothetical protein CVV44_10540 [Spirochaetae bacterium HGW-Spirochaetae-1]|nr:MAG: hypothetical protein CVV44_10540 [Spirochaetae bacterium HGW-Spirochaetae-1]